MIYIGYNYEGLPISIVNAKSKELAYAYWQGKDVLPYSHKCLEEDFTPLKDHLTGVYEILKTNELTISELTHGSSSFSMMSKKVLLVSK